MPPACRYKCKQTAALAYDQAARYINSERAAEEGVQPSRKLSRRRDLNFPHLCLEDPALAVKLQALFGRVRAAAAGSGAGVAVAPELQGMAAEAYSGAMMAAALPLGEDAAAPPSPSSWAVLAFTGAVDPALLAAHSAAGAGAHAAPGVLQQPAYNAAQDSPAPAAAHSNLTGGSSTACPPDTAGGGQPSNFLLDDSFSQRWQGEPLPLQSWQPCVGQLPHSAGPPAEGSAGAGPANCQLQQQQAASAEPGRTGQLPQHASAATATPFGWYGQLGVGQGMQGLQPHQQLLMLPQQLQQEPQQVPVSAQDPCRMPLALVDVLGDDDWAQLLATVGSNPVSAAQGGSSIQQGSSSKDSAPLLLQQLGSHHSSSTAADCAPLASQLPMPELHGNGSGGGSTVVPAPAADTPAVGQLPAPLHTPAASGAPGEPRSTHRQWSPAAHMQGVLAGPATLAPAAAAAGMGDTAQAAVTTLSPMQRLQETQIGRL